MMKKRKNVIPIIIIVGIILVCMVCLIVERIVPKNEETCIGNTAGNLNNKGLFCQDGTKVFFSNAYDDNVLYSMNVDETDYKKITNVGVSSINADGRRIYYSQTKSAEGSGLGYVRNSVGFYRCNYAGKDSICYTKDPTAIVALSGNELYFQHHYDNKTTTDQVHIDKGVITTVIEDMVSPASVVPSESGNVIYFAGMDNDHYLYELNTATNAVTLVWEHNMYHPIYQNGYIYFMDLETDYELHSYHIATGEEMVLSTDRLDFFNVYDSVIYYQKSSATEPALKRIRIDGTMDEVVMNGVFESVNITSSYAYFNEYEKATPVYHQSTFGAIAPSVFMPDVKK